MRFLIDKVASWPDQWAFLSSIERFAPERLERLLGEHEEVGVWRITRDEVR